MPTTRMAKLARWALIATPILMGIALLVTLWWANQSVAAASDTLLRGQADVLSDGLRVRLRGLGRAPSSADLRGVLAELRPEGLRYVASFDPHGRPAAEAGVAVGGVAEVASDFAEARPGIPVMRGAHARVVWRRRGRRRTPGRSTSRRRFWHGRSGMMLEFEPRVADDLDRSVKRTLAVGGVAAGVMVLLSLGLVRLLSRREELQRELERKQRLATLGQMSAVLAHEIRNPLASLKGNSQLLARMLPEGDKPRKKADRVVAEAERLEALTNDLLAFARSGEIERSPTDPVALARAAAERVGAARFDIDADGAPARWSLDGDRMEQVLVNVLDNAAASSDEPVDVTISRAGRALSIRVRDRGPGIAAEDLEHIFEPFFTRRTQGTGLGLAVAKRLVELHDGTVEASNAEGGGAELRIIIPEG